MFNFFPAKRFNAVVGAAAFLCCVTMQAAEIHEAAELGDLNRVKACLARDAKQISSTDAKGRTVLDRALLSGKTEIVEFVLANGAPEDIFSASAVGHSEKVSAIL